MSVDLGLIDGDNWSEANLNALEAAINLGLNVVTSATRPASPAEGTTIYETDTNRILYYDGAAWVILSEPPQTWNVTSITQNGARACTTTYGWYQRSNGVFKAHLVVTGFAAGSAGNAIIVPTPLTLVTANAVSGSFVYFDSGNQFYTGAVGANNTTSVGFTSHSANAAFGISPSFALAAADYLTLEMTGRYA